jgi:hypothetical protein
VLTSLAVAQQHVFTNKGGVQIIAEIESVDPDWKKMTIRKDGNAFDIEPRVLILDDQQFVKNWLKERGITAPGEVDLTSNPAIGTSINLEGVRIDVQLKQKLVDSERKKLSSYTQINTKKYSFDITVTSRGREAIPQAKVQYALVWRERVSLSANGSDYDSYDGDNPNFALIGERVFPQLAYNRDATFASDAVELHSVVEDGNAVFQEDKLLGVLVNIEMADGTQIFEYANTEARDRDLTWERVSQLPPRPGEGFRNMRFGEESEEERHDVQLSKGERKEGPINLVNKRISISAKITPDGGSPDGVIAAIGGSQAGMALYIKDRKVYGSVSKLGKIDWVAKTMPPETFDAVLEFDKTGLSLTVNKESPAKRSDISLFTQPCYAGIIVGSDNNSAVGEYPADFHFAGEIESATILIRK